MNNQLKTVLLLGVLSALVVGLGSALAPGYMYAFVLFTVVMNLGAYFFSDRLVLAMHRAREVSEAEAPRLHRTVAELAARAGIPKPRVFLIPGAQPNAFATGRNPAHGVVAVTEGIVETLSERELRGVLAHELAHIKNRDILVATIAATVAGVVSSLANAAGWMAMLGGRSDDGEDGPSALQGILLALVAPIAATVIQLAISRSREYLADETGARIAADPEALASALEKLERGAQLAPSAAMPATASLFIVSPFAGAEGIVSLFSTHPRTAERVRRLRALVREQQPEAYLRRHQRG